MFSWRWDTSVMWTGIFSTTSQEGACLPLRETLKPALHRRSWIRRKNFLCLLLGSLAFAQVQTSRYLSHTDATVV